MNEDDSDMSYEAYDEERLVKHANDTPRPLDASVIGGIVLLCAFAFMSIFGVVLGTMSTTTTHDKAPLLDWYNATVHPSYNATVLVLVTAAAAAGITGAGGPVPVPPPSLNPRYSPLPLGPADSPSAPPAPTPDPVADYIQWLKAHPPTPTI